jgi:hypothetical protein
LLNRDRAGFPSAVHPQQTPICLFREPVEFPDDQADDGNSEYRNNRLQYYFKLSHAIGVMTTPQDARATLSQSPKKT